MKADVLDELILIANAKRLNECIIFVKPLKSLSLEQMSLGSCKAQIIFPKTSKHLIKIHQNLEMDDFVNAPLESEWHLELALFTGNILGLKMSHYLGDALSMLMWIKTLLGYEMVPGPLNLKTYPSKKDTPYRKISNSEVWPRSVNEISQRRNILKFEISHSDIPSDVSLNDIFILALMEALGPGRKAIWIPVNVRKKFNEGFGNGLSRMRIYPPTDDSLKKKIANIRKQKNEARVNGEISLPYKGLNVSSPVKKALFKLWLNRPWADWGSISLSHLSESNEEENIFTDVYGVSNIMPKHYASLFAYSQNKKTSFTLTYDPAGASKSQAEFLKSAFLKNTKEIFHDLL